MRGGKRSGAQIDEAIRMYDRLLLVLSPHSIGSEWVRREIERARQKERQSKKEVLFPIRLMPFEELRALEWLESDTGEDLAAKVREYHVPDFSNWKDHDAFESRRAGIRRTHARPAPPRVRHSAGGGGGRGIGDFRFEISDSSLLAKEAWRLDG